MKNKLDSLHKIILATGQINYMATSLSSVNERIKMLPRSYVGLEEGIQERSEMLEKTVKDLVNIMEDLGDFLNNNDITCAIDERVSRVPFDILLFDKDDYDDDYEEIDRVS